MAYGYGYPDLPPLDEPGLGDGTKRDGQYGSKEWADFRREMEVIGNKRAEREKGTR